MTIAEKVVARIKAVAPKPICDDCLAPDLGFANRQQANRVTNALALAGGHFTREQATCGECKIEKLVIAARISN